MDTFARVFLLLGFLWTVGDWLNLDAPTKNDGVVCVYAARVPVRTAVRPASAAVDATADMAELQAEVERRKKNSNSKSRKSWSGARPGKMLAVLGAVVGFFASAVALWKCRAAALGATRSHSKVTGAAASRRLAEDPSEACVSSYCQQSVFVSTVNGWTEWHPPVKDADGLHSSQFHAFFGAAGETQSHRLQPLLSCSLSRIHRTSRHISPREAVFCDCSRPRSPSSLSHR
ncbi:hypothetical protein CSUI_006472 [Cystoisospora suis]|uniref:Transmembrane protein n=1 Tax=Cystoisospora suis TaxID=483139 RepID=A0A2C6KU90_9APIC|nr:hypothetical protein CSUI_006472 [Cystoisospora suis]